MTAAAEQVVLDSGAATVRIEPLLGGRIVSFHDCRGTELVEQGRPPAAPIGPGDPFLAGGLGGFDDCLPGITEERLGGDAARTVPDHGDVWSRPAGVERLTSTAVTLRQAGSAGDYQLERTYTLEGATLRVGYAVRNLRREPLSLLWAAHPLLQLTPDAELDLGAISRLRVHGGNLALPGADLEPRRVELHDRVVDLTRPGSIPPGHSIKAFAPLVPGAEIGVTYPARGVRLVLRLTAEQRAWLGVWINAYGFPADAPVAHLALEPSFGDSDSLGEAILAGTCLVVPAGATFAWSLDYAIRTC